MKNYKLILNLFVNFLFIAIKNEFDKNFKILAFNDVVLDLNTLTPQPHSYKFYITQKLNYDYPGTDFWE